MRIALLSAFVAVAAACQPIPNGSPPGGSQQVRDWAAIERLEQEARALAPTTGCTAAQGCRTAPVGNRACGGPRYYLVYCATSTDSVALYRKLDEIVRAENDYNRRYGIISTCEFRMPPEIAFSGGECRAAQ